MLGRISLARGDAGHARAVLAKHAPDSSDPRVTFVLGVAESRLGSGIVAVELLSPFAKSGAPAMEGMAWEESAMLLRSSLAEAHARAGNLAAAMEQWQSYLDVPGVAPHERAYVQARADDLARRAGPDAALAIVRKARGNLATAVLGTRAATALRSRGQAAAARTMDDESARLRRTLGLHGHLPPLGGADPQRLGLAVPLSGKFRVLGEVALRGSMMAVSEPTTGVGDIAAFQIHVRDSAGGAGSPDASTGELVRGESVLGIVGLADPRAITETTRDGVPFLVLDEQAPGAGTSAFQLTHSGDARAAELARRALRMGTRAFAIMGPDGPAGRRLADAFKRAAVQGGGRIVAHAIYPAGANSFTDSIAQIRSPDVEAIFIPDDADRLELVAPALAAADLWARSWSPGTPGPSTGTRNPGEVLLLSTARGLSPRLLRNAGRYVQGALLSPGYYAAAPDPGARRFLEQFRLHYRQDPSATDAYCYDAVRVLRLAIERGAKTRADLLRTLASGTFEGVTGNVRFGPDHGRADPPLVYVVQGEEIKLSR
jgi:ABC-type branched-subunit amino acid transport system substrate-binding protein